MAVVTTGCLYGGYKQNDNIKAYWTTCNITEDCELYKSGKCACFRYLIGPDLVCPNAKTDFSFGPTKRAKSYESFKNKFEKMFKDNVEEFNKKLSRVPNYIFIPTGYLTSARTKIGDEVINGHFIKEEEFTEDFIQRLVTFKPLPWFGDVVISDYPNKEVPKFVQQLKEVFPEIYKKWETKYPDTANEYKDMSPVGRIAYIRTLPNGCEIKSPGGTFVKMGNLLICENYRSALLPFNAKTAVCQIEITDNMSTTVKEDTLVDDNTEFVD